MKPRICFALFFIVGLLSGTPCLARGGESSHPSPTEIKTSLDRILAQPEFQPEHAGENYAARILRWLGEEWEAFMKLLGRLFPHSLPISGEGAGVIVWVFVGLFVLLGAWLLAKLLLNYYRNRSSSGGRGSRSKAYTQEEYERETVTEPDAWLTQAERYAAAGDYRRAFRAVFLAVLHQMDRAGAIRFERSRTNGEYVRMLRGNRREELAAVFRALGIAFDLRWYGNRPATRADYEDGLATYRQLPTLLGNRV